MARKARLGFIGAGGFALYHLLQLADVGQAEIVALADPSDESIDNFRSCNHKWLRVWAERDPKMRARLAKAVEKASGANTYSDHEHMLETETLDGVLINTPHTLHYQQIRDCIGRGIAVLCEKPLVSKTEHAKAVIAEARRRKVLLTVGYQRHTMPEFRYVRDVIASGGLGRLNFVSALLCQDWYHLTENTWRRDPKLAGGGQLNDSGSHIMDMLLFVTGRRPTQVFCWQDNCGLKLDVNTATSIRFGKDLIGSVNVLGRSPFQFFEEWTFNGTEGAITIREGKVRRIDASNQPVPVTLPKPEGTIERQFVRAVLNDGKPPVDPLWALRVIQLTEAAWRSARTKQPEKVDWSRS